MLSHRRRDKFSKIAGMNTRIVLSWVDFWTVTLRWKNGHNEAEDFMWMLLLTGKTVHRWWSELSVAPSGQKTKQSEVACRICRCIILETLGSLKAFITPDVSWIVFQILCARNRDIALHSNFHCSQPFRIVWRPGSDSSHVTVLLWLLLENTWLELRCGLCQIRSNQGVTKDNLTTPPPPTFVPPLLLIAPWLFEVRHVWLCDVR